VLELVQEEHSETARLLVAGHEPTWSDTVSQLIGGANLRFPTAAVARIDFDISHWSQVAFGRGELIWLIPPKALTGLEG
jgi:phosphohistidine phosphatase